MLGNAGPTLTPAELQNLEKLNCLYHDSLNGSLAMMSMFSPGLDCTREVHQVYVA